METLWAPWRMEYILSDKDQACIFCEQPKAADWRAVLVLAQSRSSVVMINRYPYTNAHLMVAPRRHTNDLSALGAEEYAELGETLRRTVGLLKDLLHPEGMNVGLNLGLPAGAGIEDHLHWHVCPRWVGDTNFMPLIGEVRVIPQHLEELYDRLRPVFAVLDEK